MDAERSHDRSLVVEMHQVHKAFGRVKALDGLDLCVEAGQVHGFLGPNGAGKSTAIRALLGLIRADAGQMRVLGLDPWADPVTLHRRLAYVPGDVALWPTLTGGEAVDNLLALHAGGRLSPEVVARRDELVDRFELDLARRCRTYSKGNRQKVALVAAFATDAELFLLDEPTSGLDPLMAAQFARCVREVTARGAAVLLSSHIMAEVADLAHAVTIIRHGRAVHTGPGTDAATLRSVFDAQYTRPGRETSEAARPAEPVEGDEERSEKHDDAAQPGPQGGASR
ncbi:MAG: ABC transporter ATP-binding protein [Micrococcales bacterium]|nr:ABC transporter ATP-binding protein [Micrococcales bacterium]